MEKTTTIFASALISLQLLSVSSLVETNTKTYADNNLQKIEREIFLNQDLTLQQRTYAVDELKRTKSLLNNELKGLSETQLNFKSAEGKWSIAEVTEHIALAENGIYQIIEGSLKAPANPAKRSEITVTDTEISKRLTNRAYKVQSPEVIKPTGKFPDTKSAYQAFESRRDATMQYITNTNDDLQNHFWQHPATGTIDLYQAILLISAHSERHILQIIEVKSDKNFPKK